MQLLKPIRLLQERVKANGADSDASLFHELLYIGEFLVKSTASVIISGIEADTESHQYRLLHSAVRADGIGEWAAILDQALSGPASQHLCAAAREIRRTFTERSVQSSWQDRAVKLLSQVLRSIYPEANPSVERPQFRAWFQIFSEIRNKTRGHGAITPATASRVVRDFSESIDLVIKFNPVLNLPWAYLHRNLSGKYRVINLGGSTDSFANLKTVKGLEADNYPAGIYVELNGYRRLALIGTDLDANDFFVANGNFKNTTYELHSLITDNRIQGDATPYLTPATQRPPSETTGQRSLGILEQTFSNLPPTIKEYIKRSQLETEVKEALTNDRHPIVTLVGRGGIGKTSTALAVLHDIARSDRFSVIVWFSARDIDLTVSGAKSVKPQVLTEREIAKEYLDLIGHQYKEESPQNIMALHLRSSPLGNTLFVFDNFETVRNPIDLFGWIDNNIRLPNKAVITSRFRDFKADYPITVSGMEGNEAEQLIKRTSNSIGISGMIGIRETAELIQDSDGHPYIIKIVLGEIANAGSYSKPARIIARKDDILDALFERTYSSLSPLAVRAFLILCSWRALVPQLGLEAVLLRQIDESTDPEAAINQLVRSSLVVRLSAGDGSDFLEVPLTAATFGRKKVAVTQIRTTIENDVKFLQEMGATATSGLKNGLAPRIDAFFKQVARKAASDPSSLDENRPVLEFFASHHRRAWLLIAQIDYEQGNTEKAADALRRFLETQPEATLAHQAWHQLVQIYRSNGEVVAALDAVMQAAEIVKPPFSELSIIAHWLNNSPDAWSHLATIDRMRIFRPLAMLMEENFDQASATDLSRAAWLYLHADDEKKALHVAEEGLQRDPQNSYCQKIRKKLLAGDSSKNI